MLNSYSLFTHGIDFLSYGIQETSDNAWRDLLSKQLEGIEKKEWWNQKTEKLATYMQGLIFNCLIHSNKYYKQSDQKSEAAKTNLDNQLRAILKKYLVSFGTDALKNIFTKEYPRETQYNYHLGSSSMPSIDYSFLKNTLLNFSKHRSSHFPLLNQLANPEITLSQLEKLFKLSEEEQTKITEIPRKKEKTDIKNQTAESCKNTPLPDSLKLIPGLRGFKNLNLTCFVSSTLLVIIHTCVDQILDKQEPSDVSNSRRVD